MECSVAFIKLLTGHVTVVDDVVIATAAGATGGGWSTTAAIPLVCSQMSTVDETSLARAADDDVTRQLYAFHRRLLASEA